MAFDFSKVKVSSAEIKKTGIPKLIAIVGPRASGKSGCLATAARDKKMLLLQFKYENHSYSSALGVSRSLYGDKCVENITPYNLDSLEGKEITGDALLGQLLDLLNDEKTAQYFPVVALDSMSALDIHLACCTEILNSDKFTQSKATSNIYTRIFSAAKTYMSRGGIFIFTLASEIYFDGGIRVNAPKLRGSSSVSLILGESAVIVLADKIHVGEGEDANVQHVFSFSSDVSKTRQKIVRMTKGTDGKTVVDSVPQQLSFSPRISGIATQDLPAILPADLNLIFDLIDGKNISE